MTTSPKRNVTTDSSTPSVASNGSASATAPSTSAVKAMKPHAADTVPARSNGKHPGGRPSKLTPKLISHLILMARRGFTDAEMADVIGVAEQSLYNWRDRPEYLEFIKASKEESDQCVVASLFDLAHGYEYYEDVATLAGPVRIKKRVKPDVVACIFWLKNRQRKLWREREAAGEGEAKAPKLYFVVNVSQNGKTKRAHVQPTAVRV